ncbi:hypothetical protein ISF_06782 [Cordyceps fumosorosea ARSEF 2679]|uniref:Uncharacterized protein n=1 Tax=Cordyceps fumosorosea (strain ARSEF 2679) TaxID=1081104 RepID=A0A167R3P9_CORFA|nr:hypothetical protein ISF_06782 [Cordyceps fumosorosea ARSEF 2679]OAA58243.1 hypothetical protein ISF_06782 [Cordyceps fumosorosea ARSEF 2679]
MVRITVAALLAFVAIASASSPVFSDGVSVSARADEAADKAGAEAAPAPEDLKQLDTLIDAVQTFQDMLKNLKQDAGGAAQ